MNIDIDADLLDQVMRSGGFSSAGAAINAALAAYLPILKRRELLGLRGQVPWHGALDALRAGDPRIDEEPATTRLPHASHADECVALSVAASSLDQLLAAAGISESEFVHEFLELRTRKPE